jgi:hypothetical protein
MEIAGGPGVENFLFLKDTQKAEKTFSDFFRTARSEE